MARCSECKFGEFFHSLDERYIMYYCHRFEEWIEEKTAELEDLGCDGFEYDDRYDDFTERQGKHRGSILTPVDV